MRTLIHIVLFFLFISNAVCAQTIDDPFPQKKMQKDLKVFKNIRLEANSGLYKHRSKAEIDSIYAWADTQILKTASYRDFYNIICKLTSFEGSLHNDTALPKKMKQAIKEETSGYFPYPIKWIDNQWIFNLENAQIPLGAEILSINNETMASVIKNLNKYYTTDGHNLTGKRIGIEYSFGKYYRLNYGLTDSFSVEYKGRDSNTVKRVSLKSIGFSEFYKNVESRYSKPFDAVNYKDWDEDDIYTYKKINANTGMLSINSFSMGNQNDPRHLRYVAFLDSIFNNIKTHKVENLIVDIRYNGGGTDPNDLVTYSYLTDRNFSENKDAWISFKKIPYLRYMESDVPAFLRFLGVGKYNKEFQKEFYIAKENGYYQGPLSDDHKIWTPNEHAFNGTVYLLISPRLASAGSLFGAMLTGNKNSTVIGEEAMGGYYGHNGHTSFTYILPKSKIETSFSIVNLMQDVPQKENQIPNRGIIPDYNVTPSYDDFLNHTDAQLNFALDLIKQLQTDE